MGVSLQDALKGQKLFPGSGLRNVQYIVLWNNVWIYHKAYTPRTPRLSRVWVVYDSPLYFLATSCGTMLWANIFFWIGSCSHCIWLRIIFNSCSRAALSWLMLTTNGLLLCWRWLNLGLPFSSFNWQRLRVHDWHLVRGWKRQLCGRLCIAGAGVSSASVTGFFHHDSCQATQEYRLLGPEVLAWRWRRLCSRMVVLPYFVMSPQVTPILWCQWSGLCQSSGHHRWDFWTCRFAVLLRTVLRLTAYMKVFTVLSESLFTALSDGNWKNHLPLPERATPFTFWPEVPFHPLRCSGPHAPLFSVIICDGRIISSPFCFCVLWWPLVAPSPSLRWPISDTWDRCGESCGCWGRCVGSQVPPSRLSSSDLQTTEDLVSPACGLSAFPDEGVPSHYDKPPVRDWFLVLVFPFWVFWGGCVADAWGHISHPAGLWVAGLRLAPGKYNKLVHLLIEFCWGIAIKTIKITFTVWSFLALAQDKIFVQQNLFLIVGFFDGYLIIVKKALVLIFYQM